MVLNQQGAEGKRLGGRPVDVLARLEHLALGVALARDLAIEVEVGRHPGQGLADLAQRFPRHRRLAATPVAAPRDVEARPPAPQPIGLVRLVGAGRSEARRLWRELVCILTY